MLLGRAAPVVNARLPLTEANVVSEDCGRGRGPSRQHRYRIVCTPHSVGAERSGADTRTLSCARLYRGGVVYDGPRPRPQSEETSHSHEVYGRRRH